MTTPWDDTNEETSSEAPRPDRPKPPNDVHASNVQRGQSQRPPGLEPLRRAPLDPQRPGQPAEGPAPRPAGSPPPSPLQPPREGAFPAQQDPFSQEPPREGLPAASEPPRQGMSLELDRDWRPEQPPSDASPLGPDIPAMTPPPGEEASEEMPTLFSSGLAIVGVLMVASLLGALHYFWQQSGARPVSEVEAEQLRQTLNIHRVLLDSAGQPWQTRVAAVYNALEPTNDSVAVRPVLPILAALARYTLNAAPELLFSFNVLALIVLMLGAYVLSRTWLTPGQAWYATAVVGFTPAVLGATTLYAPLMLATGCVVWGLAALARSALFKHTEWMLLFGICCGLLLLLYPPYLLYFIVPLIVCLIAGVSFLFPVQPKRDFDREGLRKIVTNLLIVVIAPTVLAFWWYAAFWWRPMAANADTTVAAVGFGSWLAPNFPDTAQAWLTVPWLLLNEGWFAPLAVLVLLGLIGVWIAFNEHLFPLLLTVLLMIGGWAAWTLYAEPLELSLLLPIAVCGALLAGSILCAIPWAGLRGVVLGGILGLLAIQFVNIATPAFGPFGRLQFAASPQLAGAMPAFPALEEIVVFKNHLNLGRDYFPTQEIDAETPHRLLLQALLHRESVTMRPGEHAPYIELGLGGAALHHRLYGMPQFTPEDGVQAVRPPLRIGYGEAALAELDAAEYVLAIVPEAEWPALEARLEEAGLIPAEVFPWNGDRDVPYQCALYMTTVDTAPVEELEAPEVTAPVETAPDVEEVETEAPPAPEVEAPPVPVDAPEPELVAPPEDTEPIEPPEIEEPPAEPLIDPITPDFDVEEETEAPEAEAASEEEELPEADPAPSGPAEGLA